MTKPDYRAMCAELLAIIPASGTGNPHSLVVARARALLAEAVAEGPTDEELPEDFIGFEKGFAQEHLARLMRDAIGTETNHNAYIVAAGRILDRPEFACVARWGRPVAAPVPEPGEVPRIGHILRLAEIIREVDGNHDKGAAALAEAILSHPGICSAGLAALDEADGPAVPDGREPASVATQPSDEELEKLAEPFSFVAEGGWDRSVYDETGYARAVLARWGRPTPQPVPLSERLPSAADCDVEDNCWWFDPHADGAWYVDTFQSCYTHWLPAHALPTPEATND